MTFALYYYDACPFCQRVLMALPQVKVEVEKRNILQNSKFGKEQKQATGRTTVPCLRIKNDTGEDTWMFESRDIIQYLKSL